jgi:hypothetical protein
MSDEEIAQLDVTTVPDDAETSCVLRCDLEYPQQITRSAPRLRVSPRTHYNQRNHVASVV